MCQVNNERERNILGEEEYQIGREPIRWRRRRKEKRERKERGKKEKEKGKERKNKKEEECVRVRGKRDGGRKKKTKRERHFPSRSPTNQRSKCVGKGDKVGSRNESYAWVPETTGFVAFQKVEVFSYTGSSLFKSRKWPCGSAQTQD